VTHGSAPTPFDSHFGITVISYVRTGDLGAGGVLSACAEKG